MVMMRILVDGFNLALEKGTGVATYARNLTYCLKGMGHDVAVLYGLKGAPGTNPSHERGFFRPSSGRPWGQRALEAYRRSSPQSDAEKSLWNQTKRRGHIPAIFIAVTHHDTLWNSPYVYDTAHTQFHLYKHCLQVMSPKDIDIAHWTYPLPVKHNKAKNIYTLHDLVPLRLPYTTLDKKSFYYKLVKKIAHQADHIVTVSETSREILLTCLG